MPHSHDHIDGECYPSVTEITGSKPKPWLKKWRAKLGEEAADAVVAVANLFGTRFHSGIEKLLRREDVREDDPHVWGALARIEAWIDENCPHPLMLEVKVWSKLHRYQGTLDCVCLLLGILVIVDWKSSKRIYPDMVLQLVAYARALFEMTGIVIKRGLIVRVAKFPPYRLESKWFDLTDEVFNEFLELRKEYGERPCDGTNVNRDIRTGAPV